MRSADVRGGSGIANQHTSAVRERLVEKHAPATANKMLSALRNVLKECRRLGLMSAEDCLAACDLKSVKGSRLPKGRLVSVGELRAMVKASDLSTAIGARNAAMLALLYSGGLRRDELVHLDVEHYTRADDSLRVVGKGNKERMVFIINGAVRALHAWLDKRGDEPGPLFLPVHHSGVIGRERLTTQAVWHALEGMARGADVEKFSPHDLRRTFISELLDAGVDIATVQDMAGHASIATTKRYERRGDETRRRAAAKIHFPFD